MAYEQRGHLLLFFYLQAVADENRSGYLLYDIALPNGCLVCLGELPVDLCKIGSWGCMSMQQIATNGLRYPFPRVYMGSDLTYRFPSPGSPLAIVGEGLQGMWCRILHSLRNVSPSR